LSFCLGIQLGFSIVHFSLSSYLTVHKRKEEICFKDMPTMYRVFGLIDINPNIKNTKIILNIFLIIKKLSLILQTFN